MTRAVLVLDTDYQRRLATDWIRSAKHGTRIEFKQPKRTDDQNAKMWAMLTEVATQARHHGIKLAADDWKLLFLDALKREVRMIPNLDGNGIVSLGRSSSDLSKQEMSDLIELIHEFGARNGVEFHNPYESASAPTPGDADGSGAASPGPAADDISSQEIMEAGDIVEQAEPSSSPASELSRADCIKAFMRTATDAALDVAGRRNLLEDMKDWWKDALSADLDFVKACLSTADKVAKGEIQEAAARKYLDTIPAPKGGS